MKHPVDGWDPANQLRLVVFPIIYRVSAPSQVVSRISAINSIIRNSKKHSTGLWEIQPKNLRPLTSTLVGLPSPDNSKELSLEVLRLSSNQKTIRCGEMGQHSNEQWAKPWLVVWYIIGDESSYPVIWGLFHQPLYIRKQDSMESTGPRVFWPWLKFGKSICCHSSHDQQKLMVEMGASNCFQESMIKWVHLVGGPLPGCNRGKWRFRLGSPILKIWYSWWSLESGEGAIAKVNPGKVTWNLKSWRFGSDDFPFQTGDFQVPC